MSWSGGTYTRSDGTYSGATVWLQNKNAGVKIVTTRHDLHDQDLATGINTCLTKDGQNTPTADLPMGGFRHTGVGTAQNRTQYFTGAQVADNAAQWCGTAVSTAGTMFSVSNTFAGTALTIGLRIQFISTQASTASTYISVSGAGSALLAPSDGTSALATDGVGSGELVDVMYSNLAGGIFQKMNARSTSNTFTSLNVTSIGTVATAVIPLLLATAGSVSGTLAVGTLSGNTLFTGTKTFSGTAIVNQMLGTTANVSGTMGVGTLVGNVAGNPVFTGTVTHFRTVGTTGSYSGLVNVGTLSPTQGILGVSTNSDAAAGFTGEFSSGVGTNVALTTGTAKTIATLVLQPGDYNLYGGVAFSPSSTTTISLISCGIGTAADALPGDPDYQKIAASFTTGVSQILSAPQLRFSVATAGTYYMNALAAFGVGTMTANARIFARRPR